MSSYGRLHVILSLLVGVRSQLGASKFGALLVV